MTLPRVLIIDDMFGRSVQGSFNDDRLNLCLALSLDDQTGDLASAPLPQGIIPQAMATFIRGQSPVSAGLGDVVENDLDGALAKVKEEWIEAMAKGKAPLAMVLLDLCFYTGRVTEESHKRTPGMPEGRSGDDDLRSYFGLSLLDSIHCEFPELPVFILSSKPRDEVSLEFSRRGALGFIARDDLRAAELFEEALWQHGLLPDSSGEVIGNSLPVLLALREARRAARHRENLLIRGERGTGKELLARYIHRMGGKAKQGGERSFVTVNSAAFTPNLFTSELFGIEARTATGVDGKIGLIEMADQGDLFLDEIADMPSEVQAAVLRVLQDRQVSRVGSRQSRDVDVRFLSATNADLENESGRFRPDLLDRLRLGGTIWLPSLRERPTDIPLLAEKFVREAEAQCKGSLRRDVTPEALDALRSHDWPGNIRELRSVLFDAVNRFPDVEHLVPKHLRLGTGKKQPDVERSAYRIARAVSGGSNAEIQGASLDDLLSQLAGIRFDARNPSRWAGKLGELQHAHASLVAQMFQAALEATKRRTPERPEGIIQIHPAAKLITGDATLTASKAADLIKRLLGPLEDELGGDLREALAIAVRLRPRSGKATNG